MTPKHFIVAAALIGAAVLAGAEQRPAPIRFLESQGADIVGTFDAPGGLKAYAARYRGDALGIYLTPDGKHAIVGTLLNGKGEDVSRPTLQRLVDASPAGIDWAALGKAAWIAEGDKNGERIVYAFTGPNCPYCAMFWEKARPYLKRPGVQLRHIMVGILRPSSLPKAAAILAADDPAATLARHERTLRQGGIPATGNIPEAAFRKVKANSRLMQDNAIHATPAIVYKDATGAVRQIQGVPSDEMMKTLFSGAR